ncbi:ribose transport system substrate-binding protein [Muricomes intestini]|uniref:Ribose transport system substrate-binding protein n=1 Tax=Muricomes intestini TaxID=1796634 RepID=A0A4R3JZH7_9FIRM|nr:sugar ABC transporter substrate-binding protein [Muricomes intestini]TCS72872.1 ribose transport system substrate-binding protein [Muricomes intestini]
MKIKKIVAVVTMIALCLSMAACGKTTSDSNSESQKSGTSSSTESDSKDKLQIVATVQSQQINFWSNVQHTLERLAEENNFDLTVMDINSDVTTFNNIIDDIISMRPDGVITCGLESSTLTTQVKKLQEADIPVVTYNMQPDKEICPMVITDHEEFGKVAGVAAAEYWKKQHPDTKPVGGAVDLYSAPVCALRVQGFEEGFQTVYPDFEVLQSVDGAGSRSTSLSAAEDMLQANPDINVIFGINADSGLGALDALKENGKGNVEDSLVACVDGTETDCAELKNPDSALKAVAGNSPRIMAETAWKLLSSVLDGDLPAKEGHAERMEIVSVTPDQADSWVKENFE